MQTRSQMSQLCRDAGRPLGLVPTMGYLHRGHLSLVRRAREENATVAVSVFVNPSQFGSHEDLDSYPRNMERDLKLLDELSVDLVFAPSPQEMYPDGFDTWVEPGRAAQRLEGEWRPGHFRGVATVVVKLLNILRPDRAYFGQKDGQQAAVVRRMAADLDTGVEIVVLPTVREEDGLACSSRNAYLSPQERAAAPIIFKALSSAEDLWKGGERDAEALRDELCRVLASEPLVSKVDYVSVADSETLEELETIDRQAMLSVALHIGKTRLIDNILVG